MHCCFHWNSASVCSCSDLFYFVANFPHTTGLLWLFSYILLMKKAAFLGHHLLPARGKSAFGSPWSRTVWGEALDYLLMELPSYLSLNAEQNILTLLLLYLPVLSVIHLQTLPPPRLTSQALVISRPSWVSLTVFHCSLYTLCKRG